MVSVSTLPVFALLSLATALPANLRRGDSGPTGNVVGSVLRAGSSNEAGNSNDGTAVGNGNGNTGASASASDFLNWASAAGNGVGNDDDGNSVINLKRDDSSSVENILGSVVGTASENIAGNGNTAKATGNGNDNQGASASAGNFLNGASASDNGVGNGDDGNSVINSKRGDAGGLENILGSVVGTGSGNEAGDGNSASASQNGNSNTGATSSASNFLNGASATNNGVGNGDDDNSVISLRKRLAKLEDALLQKRSSCECDTLGSAVFTGASNLAATADSGSALNNGNDDEGTTVSLDNALDGASAQDNGILNDDDNNTLVALPQTITIL